MSSMLVIFIWLSRKCEYKRDFGGAFLPADLSTRARRLNLTSKSGQVLLVVPQRIAVRQIFDHQLHIH